MTIVMAMGRTLHVVAALMMGASTKVEVGAPGAVTTVMMMMMMMMMMKTRCTEGKGRGGALLVARLRPGKAGVTRQSLALITKLQGRGGAKRMGGTMHMMLKMPATQGSRGSGQVVAVVTPAGMLTNKPSILRRRHVAVWGGGSNRIGG